MYTAFHSLLRMAYVLKHPSYTLIAQPKKVVKHLRLGAMTNDEYENLLIVYQRAFEHHTLEEFDLALYEILYFSMSSHFDPPDSDLLSPYIQIAKILDASWLVYPRGFKKIKKS